MAYETRGSRVFPYSNTTFQQMESSGSLRLIRNDEISYYIINYNNTINTDIRSLESRLLETEKKQAELQNNLLNDTLYPSTEDINYKHGLKTKFFKPGDHIPVFNQSQQAQFLKLYNLLFERNIINSYYKLELGKLKEKNEVLVAAIRKHYNL